MREIDSVWKPADGRLKNVRRCGRAARLVPLSIAVQKRGFFLHTGDRDSETLVLRNAQRGAGETRDDLRHAIITDWIALDSTRWTGFHILWQKLEGTDTVMSDGA